MSWSKFGNGTALQNIFVFELFICILHLLHKVHVKVKDFSYFCKFINIEKKIKHVLAFK